MKQNRRDFVKTSAIAATALTAGVNVASAPALAQGVKTSDGTRPPVVFAAQGARFSSEPRTAVWLPRKVILNHRSTAGSIV